MKEARMNFSKYKREDGYFSLSENGCQYDTEFELIIFEILKFCGCGDPEDAAIFVRDVLAMIDPQQDGLYEKREAYFNNNGMEFAVYYWLTELGLLEHGGCVPGWRTDLGNEVLEDLTEYFNVPKLEKKDE